MKCYKLTEEHNSRTGSGEYLHDKYTNLMCLFDYTNKQNYFKGESRNSISQGSGAHLKVLEKVAAR